MLLTLKTQPFFALQSNLELNHLCNWWWTHPAHFSALLVSWLSFHCFIFFSVLSDNYIAPAQYKWSCTSSGSIVDLFKVRTPCVFWAMSIPQCIWVSLQSSWKFLRIILPKSIVKVFISLPLFCLVSEQAGLGWAGILLSPALQGVLQADPWLPFTSAEHGQMTVLVPCQSFTITFLVLWAPSWPPVLSHASPNGFTVYGEQLVLFLQADTAAYQCGWD